MMFSTHEQFVYDQCADCDSIQISEVLSYGELSKHYPKEYYSFNSDPGKMKGLKEFAKTFLLTERDRGVFGRSVIGRLIETVKPEPTYVWVIHQVGVREDKRLLDVGCGAGAFLNRLVRLGFRNV